MYGKLMSIPDSLMLRYLTLVTRLPEEEIREIAQGLSASRIHPMEAKKRLASTVTAQYHGEAAAREAEAAFVRVFQGRQDPEKIEEIELPGGAELRLVEILVATEYVSTKSEARRQIIAGAVDVDGARVSDPNATPLADGRKRLIRAGKRFWKWVRPA
jgi:tyrosyl-tRNA synthetase